ncbi:sugar transferase, partial [Gordonia sp. CNJ-863]|uniref:sugar transferase n=1 Tax=Gordonia sp. CNJ-863 TaxID=1904963 RepID=UPI001115104A
MLCCGRLAVAHRPAYDGLGRDTERAPLKLRFASRGRERSRSWIHGYVVRLAWSDALIVAIAVAVAQLARFGADRPLVPNGTAQMPATLVSVALGVTWILALRAFQTLDRRIVGSGSQEYSRVVTACMSIFGVLAMVDLLFRLNIARGFIAIALPVGTAGLLISRWIWRQQLGRQRLKSKSLEHVLVVGSESSAVPMIDRLLSQPNLGYRVVGLCLPERTGHRGFVTVAGTDIRVYGSFDDVCGSVLESGATSVAVTSAEALGHNAMQALSWDLEGLDVDMMVSPGVTDVAGPRVMVRPVAGLPLLHIDKPRYEGANRFRKALVDRVGAAILLTVLAPVLLAVAVAIKLDSQGPVFYRALRVGLNNAPFTMWKFRSMVQDAESLKDVLRAHNEGAGVLFKMHDDPRVTRVGRFIRRYSLDELRWALRSGPVVVRLCCPSVWAGRIDDDMAGSKRRRHTPDQIIR